MLRNSGFLQQAAAAGMFGAGASAPGSSSGGGSEEQQQLLALQRHHAALTAAVQAQAAAQQHSLMAEYIQRLVAADALNKFAAQGGAATPTGADLSSMFAGLPPGMFHHPAAHSSNSNAQQQFQDSKSFERPISRQ